MTKLAHRRTLLAAGLMSAALIAAGCSSSTGEAAPAATTSAVSATSVAATSEAEASTPSTADGAATETATSSAADQVTITGERDVEVTLTGPIGAKYASATDAQRETLGKALTGDHNAGTRESGVVFQQFQGGVIVAKNDEAGTPAYITWGKIRDAWNIERDPSGVPSPTGKNGSPGPLGVPTSDVVTDGDVETTTFENGTVTHNTATGKVTVTVNGKSVPSGL